MGLCRVLVLVLTRTLRTRPVCPGRVFITRPKGQEFLGAVGSTTTTMSFSLKFLLMWAHFCRCCIRVRYSVVHLFQKRFARYCTCFHRFLVYKSSFLKSPGGKSGLLFSCRRWFGVSGSRSFGSLEAVVIGRSFRMVSSSHKAV